MKLYKFDKTKIKLALYNLLKKRNKKFYKSVSFAGLTNLKLLKQNNYEHCFSYIKKIPFSKLKITCYSYKLKITYKNFYNNIIFDDYVNLLKEIKKIKEV